MDSFIQKMRKQTSMKLELGLPHISWTTAMPIFYMQDFKMFGKLQMVEIVGRRYPTFQAQTTPTELVQSKSSPQTLWCIRANKTYKTTDGGGNWVEITMPKPNLRGQLAIDPTNANRIWVGYENTVANNKVFKSEDGGTNWTNISGTLPNIPVNDIVYQEASNGRLVHCN